MQGTRIVDRDSMKRSFPDNREFCCNLTMKEITDADYNYAKKILRILRNKRFSQV